jgi:hypothetical protein
MRKSTRSRVLDVEDFRELLDLTTHQVRALTPNNNDADDFPYHLYNYAPRVGGHAPLSADKEAR